MFIMCILGVISDIMSDVLRKNVGHVRMSDDFSYTLSISSFKSYSEDVHKIRNKRIYSSTCKLSTHTQFHIL